jgi:nitroreductase
VDAADLKVADTETLRAIAELAGQSDEVNEELTAAVRSARRARRSWSEIGAMLGVSKQAAQRKYASKISA